MDQFARELTGEQLNEWIAYYLLEHEDVAEADAARRAEQNAVQARLDGRTIPPGAP